MVLVCIIRTVSVEEHEVYIIHGNTYRDAKNELYKLYVSDGTFLTPDTGKPIVNLDQIIDIDVVYYELPDTLTIHAIHSRNLEELEWAILQDININAFDCFKQTALLYEAVYGNLEFIDKLLENGAKVDLCGGDKVTPLIKAVRHWNINVVKRLIDAGANIETLDEIGCTPLIIACTNLAIDIVRILIDAKANLNCRLNDNEFPLLIACYKDSYELVDILVTTGADVNLKTKHGKSAIMVAAKQGNLNIVQRLVSAGAVDKIEAEKISKNHGKKEVADYLKDKCKM